MFYSLPTSVDLNGEEWPNRADYRAVLDICAALSDPEWSDQEKVLAALTAFYPGFDRMPPALYEDALKACFRFINLGTDEKGKKRPKLMDWEQDAPFIFSAVNRIAGREVRAIPYDDGMVTETAGLHWYTFLGYYYEIGDCAFAQIVGIRNKQKRGKRLEKHEQAFYREKRELVDLKSRYTDEQADFLARLAKKGGA